jgi:hypothetical protein
MAQIQNSTEAIEMSQGRLPERAVAPADKRWKFVSFLVSLGMLSFFIGYNCLTLRDQGNIQLPNILIFPWFVLGICATLWGSLISVAYGIRKKVWVKLFLLLFGLLTCWSLVIGHYNSTFAVREAFFSQAGIGVWIAFLLVVPGQNARFWAYFEKHLLTIYKIALLIEIAAIVLMTLGNRGLLRVNFSTSLSLFILGWGILSSRKSLIRWGMIGVALFLIHSVVHDQRETFLLPIEFALLFLPVYLKKSFGNKRSGFPAKLLRVSGLVSLLILLVPVVYLTMPGKYQQIFTRAHLTDDTRTMVLKDYRASEMLQPGNFLLGKGVNGFYKSRIRHNPIGGMWTSTVIEVGYLQMILNVGAIYAVMMILMGLIPSIKAILRPRNALAAMAGVWVLMRLINMGIAAQPRSDFGWFFFWLCIGLLLSKEMTKAEGKVNARRPARALA